MMEKPKCITRPSDDATMQEWAEYYAKLGIPVFPIVPRTKDSYYPDYKHRGKPSKKYPTGNPYSWSAQATTDLKRVQTAWKEHPDASIGGMTGNGLYVIDGDERENGNYRDTLDKWDREGILPNKLNLETWISITGSGGKQFFYYLSPENVKKAKDHHINLAGDADMIEMGSHVDTRGDGRYVLLPPSIHPNGNKYRWDEEKNPSTTEMADFDRTVEYIFTHKSKKSSGRKSTKTKVSNGELVPKGSRRSYMLSKAGELVPKMADIVDDSAIVSALLDIAHTDLDLSEPLDSGWDGLKADMEKVVSDFRASLEKERAEGQDIDYTYCVRAWYMENPEKQLPDPIDWEEIRAAGQRRKEGKLKIREPMQETETIKTPTFRVNEKGNPYNDVWNMVTFVEFLLGKSLRFNEFSGKLEIFGAVPWSPDDTRIRTWTETDTCNVLRLANSYRLTSKNFLEDAIDIVSHNNAYNPLTDFLDSLEYKGEGYIAKIAVDYLGCDDTDYTRGVMKLLYLGLVQRAYHPGCKNDNVTVLVGGQGSYKSSFSRVIVRNDEFFTDSIDSFGDKKKVAEQLQGKWLAEIPEMSAMRKSDMESVKACISSTCDSYREPYARRSTDHLRYTVFIGTTNSKTFLKDATGNRRFLPLQVNPARRKKDLFTSETRDADFDGAMAEAVHIFKEETKNGKLIPLILPKELLPEAQEKQNNANAYEEWRGLIEIWLDRQVHDPEEPKQYTCGIDIWCNCFGKEKGTFTNKEAYRINQILDDLPMWDRASTVRITNRTREGYIFFDYHGRGFRYNPAWEIEAMIETDTSLD